MTPARYLRLQHILNQRQIDLTLVMENVHKSHNFSAILRSCESVGIYQAHVITRSGLLSQHHATAAGAQKWLKVQCHTDTAPLYQMFKQQNYQILATSLRHDSQDFRRFDYTQPTAIVMGSELHGVSDYAQTHATACITIPMHGLVESLNVSVAAAVILYEAQRQRSNAGYYKKRQLPEAEYRQTLFEWCYPEVAAHCQKSKKAYPPLDNNGYIQQ